MPDPLFEKLPGQPIILVRQRPGMEVQHDQQQSMTDVLKLVGQQPAPIFLVIDISAARIRIDQISRAAEAAARSTSGLLHHPNVQEVVFVTPSAFARSALELLRTSLYHEVHMTVVDTLDEALDYCRSRE